MLPPLPELKRGLALTTEALATELAHGTSGTTQPAWSELEWRLAGAAAVAHGVSPLLAGFSTWAPPGWQDFLASQREHVEIRQQRIAGLLAQMDARARRMALPLVALKGSALHALGLYIAGERPMADIDLLVRPRDLPVVQALLEEMGYEESFRQWKHRVFKPHGGMAVRGLGEHRDTPVNIEVHTRIHERLPIRTVDITDSVWPEDAAPGIQPYPSTGALMAHLLLHAAGNICGRSLRLLHLHDIAQLARRMPREAWNTLWEGTEPPWWAWPPLRLVARYFPGSVPRAVLERTRRDCPRLLRLAARRQTITRVSCSNLWLNLLPGAEWARTAGDISRLLVNRVRPTTESREERADMLRTQVWLQGQTWVRRGHVARLVTGLTRPVPRMDTLYVVRAALGELA
ncbi:nucleotidyltransferase family protein [Luteibacter pinisoli]|uniref:Nucleotidyltransferase family protein n=1 Tax=Luteibacter pinisoli TaxID=2589080 RepID=A0A4Y5YZ92_9GAMM|nr:nucleotidyltransferase family protein [Luteibacter pinisoli]QDE38330.1 nucleotidyltransferase family protein [Luteibacter pinisoli]